MCGENFRAMEEIEKQATAPRYILCLSEFCELTHQTKEAFFSILDEGNKGSSGPLVPLPGNRAAIPFDLVRTLLKKKGIDYLFRKIAFVNMKGGVGKTISCITAASRAVQYGFKTCILDMDSQASASLAFDKMPDEDDPIFLDVWQKPAETVMPALRSIDENFFILPSSLENGLLDFNLMNPRSQKEAVWGVCEELRKNGFDLVMIDCPPSLGTAVISSICAADTVLIPTGNDAFSFKGLELTISEVSSICSTFQMEQPEVRILHTRFDKRLKLSLHAEERLRQLYKSLVIPVPIRTSSEFSKALEKKETVFSGTRKSFAREDYDTCVRSLLGLNSVFVKEKGREPDHGG